jgi:hypothetical protein
LILCLDARIGIPCCCVSTEVGVVGWDSTVVAPIVYKIDDSSDSVDFGALDDVVEALEAVGTGVNLWRCPGNEALIPYSCGALSDVVKSYNIQYRTCRR